MHLNFHISLMLALMVVSTVFVGAQGDECERDPRTGYLPAYCFLITGWDPNKVENRLKEGFSDMVTHEGYLCESHGNFKYGDEGFFVRVDDDIITEVDLSKCVWDSRELEDYRCSVNGERLDVFSTHHMDLLITKVRNGVLACSSLIEILELLTVEGDVEEEGFLVRSHAQMGGNCISVSAELHFEGVWPSGRSLCDDQRLHIHMRNTNTHGKVSWSGETPHPPMQAMQDNTTPSCNPFNMGIVAAPPTEAFWYGTYRCDLGSNNYGCPWVQIKGRHWNKICWSLDLFDWIDAGGNQTPVVSLGTSWMCADGQGWSSLTNIKLMSRDCGNLCVLNDNPWSLF